MFKHPITLTCIITSIIYMVEEDMSKGLENLENTKEWVQGSKKKYRDKKEI